MSGCGQVRVAWCSLVEGVARSPGMSRHVPNRPIPKCTQHEFQEPSSNMRRLNLVKMRGRELRRLTSMWHNLTPGHLLDFAHGAP